MITTPIPAVSATGARIETADERSETLLLAEEALRVGKRERVTGRVTVRTVTTEREELVAQDLAQDDVEVTRVPVGREVDAAPAVREEGEVTIIPVLEEIIVVEKRLVLKEEIHIRRMRSTERVETPVTLRRQDAVIERLDADDAPNAGDPA